MYFGMLETSSFFWLPSIIIVTQNFGLSRGILVEKWIRQYQDHFDYANDNTWLMRYYENDEFYHRTGPIFIMIGGESAITPDSVKSTDFMYETAKLHGAMMYGTEHRYYGKSHPVPDTSVKNLRYLSVPQTLADIAWFIEMKKHELNNPNAFTIVFGCSYSGNLAAWMRVEYPNLVQGALASSAPIYIKADFFEFYEFVGDSIHKSDKNCAMDIKEAFSALGRLLENPAINSIKLENDFNLYNPDFFQSSEISYMMLNLASIFSSATLYNTIEVNGKTSIENLCLSMRKNGTISSYYRLAEVFKKNYLENNTSINLKYSHSLTKHLQTSWESEMIAERLWIYQTCTELGYHQTLSSSNSMFGSIVPQEYFRDLCRDIFAAVFNLDYLNHNIRRINRLYNSKLSNTKNIIFTNGNLDPWSSLSVLSDLNKDSPAILVDGTSHCDLLIQDETTETDSLLDARCQVSLIIWSWLNLSEN